MTMLHQQRPKGATSSVACRRSSSKVLHSHGEQTAVATRAPAAPGSGHEFGALAIHALSPVRVQPKLAINRPGDIYEQEADRVAEQVMRMPDPAKQPPQRASEKSSSTTLKREAALQRKESSAAVGPHLSIPNPQARTSNSDLPTSSSQPNYAPPIVHEVLRSPGLPLDRDTRTFMELRFSHDFSRVRVHADAKAAKAARVVDARAYTVGEDIVFGDGQFSPSFPEGQHLLAHELAHVVQHTASDSRTAKIDEMQSEAKATVAAQRVASGLTSGDVGRTSPCLARAPIEPAKTAETVNKSHQLDVAHLREILGNMLRSLSPQTQCRIDRNSTVAVALVEMLDDNDVPFTTLVYTTNSEANSSELTAAAERFNIQHIGGGVPRVNDREEDDTNQSPTTHENEKEQEKEKKARRGKHGAPRDAEQLLLEATSANDMKILAVAISRPPCKDCAVMIKDEEIVATWLDRTERKSALGAGRLMRRGSDTLKKAVVELDETTSRAKTTPGLESAEGLGPDAPFWATLNGLDIKELYQVLAMMQQRGRLGALQDAVKYASGIDKSRLIAVMSALAYKAQLQSPSPEDQALAGAYSEYVYYSNGLPNDQIEYLERTLKSTLRSLVKKPDPKPQSKKTSEPKNKAESTDKSEHSVFGESIKKGLKAAGVAISAAVTFEIVEAIATVLFTEFTIGAGIRVLDSVAAQKVKKAVVDCVKTRVSLAPEQLERIGETVFHEVEPLLQNAAKFANSLP